MCGHCDQPAEELFWETRPKLWELELDIHCSIIGTCVPVSELRKIYKRVNKVSSKQFDDYQIHNLFVSSADQPLVGIKMLQKYLEKTHSRVIARSKSADSEQALASLWKECVAEGNIAGGYWAVMTHTHITQGLYTRVFGQVHMMSHFAGRIWEADSLKRKQVQSRYSELLEKYKQQQTDISVLHKQISEHRKNDETQSTRILAQARDIDGLRSQLHGLKQAHKQEEHQQQITELEKKLITQRRSISLEVDRATDSVRDQLTRTSEELAAAREERQTLEQRLETLLGQSQDESEAESGEALCGRCVLYVGGQARSQASFRRLVEGLDGKFLYHDGGREDSRQRLDGLINQADAVVCPASCVSHSAMYKIKQVCSRQEKKMIWLRSPSLSAFNNALNEIATARKVSGRSRETDRLPTQRQSFQ